MSEAILYSTISIILVSLISLVGIFFVAINKKHVDKIIFFLVSLSVGVLFGDVFIHIIPELWEEAGEMTSIPVAIFVGFLTFFVLEKFFRWHHAHSLSDDECLDCESGGQLQHNVDSKKHIGNMVVFGDGMHNLIDGIVITASFLTSIPLGIATTLAVVFHEIPQEISDFGVLLHAGYSKMRAVILNFGSALMSLFGIVLVITFKDLDGFLVLANAFTAGGFIYIAGSDLVPELHRTTAIGRSLIQFFAIILGFCIMILLTLLEAHA